MFGRKKPRHPNTMLKKIWVTDWEGKQKILELPSDCQNWEIIGGDLPYQPVKFLAIRIDGSIAYIRSYGSNQWKEYTALS